MTCFKSRAMWPYSDRWLMNIGAGAICALPLGFIRPTHSATFAQEWTGPGRGSVMEIILSEIARTSDGTVAGRRVAWLSRAGFCFWISQKLAGIGVPQGEGDCAKTFRDKAAELPPVVASDLPVID